MAASIPGTSWYPKLTSTFGKSGTAVTVEPWPERPRARRELCTATWASAARAGSSTHRASLPWSRGQSNEKREGRGALLYYADVIYCVLNATPEPYTLDPKP